MPSQLDTFSTPGVTTYTIPATATKVDFVVLGGGGGGQGGGAGFANGRSGAAGTYSAGLTLTRGVDFPWGKTTFPVTVGSAGAGGNPGNGSAGGDSAVNVEYGAAGAGASGSGTGSVTLSWTHTPNGYDNYVVVSLAASVVGGSFSTHTRTVTYGGVTMTSLGAVNANNGTSGWVESFGVAVTPMAGPKQVAVTVSKAAAVYSSVKGNSVSYGNINAATVSATTNFGSSTSALAASTYGGVGGTVVSSVLGLTSTVSGTVSGVTHRSLDNAAPSFLILENPFAFGLIANFAATTQFAVVSVALPSRISGLGGAANSITWVDGGRGGSPGNKSFNGQTYVGGTGSLNTGLGAQPAAATAPGAGGGGSGGFLLGLTANGGSGSAGRVWIFSTGQVADAAQQVSSATTATVSKTISCSASLGVTASVSANAIETSRGSAALAVTSAATATGQAVDRATSALGATSAATASAGYGVQGALPVVSAATASASAVDRAASSLAVTSVSQPAIRNSTSGGASLGVAAATGATVVRSPVLISASLAAVAATSANAQAVDLASASLSVQSAATATGVRGHNATASLAVTSVTASNGREVSVAASTAVATSTTAAAAISTDRATSSLSVTSAATSAATRIRGTDAALAVSSRATANIEILVADVCVEPDNRIVTVRAYGRSVSVEPDNRTFAAGNVNRYTAVSSRLRNCGVDQKIAVLC